MIAAGSGFRTGDGGFAHTDPGTEAGAIEAIRLILAHGGDINAISASGETPLHLAVARGGDAIVRFLGEQGAARGPVRESTAAILRELMASAGTAVN